MYDISFILPLTIKNKNYSKRIPLFKKYGLLNIKDKKIKLFILVGNEDIESVEDNWDYDVEVLKCNYSYAVYKLHKFYISLTKKIIFQSKWFMQLDDDSITNVSDLVDKLNKNYNYKDEYNITGINPLGKKYLKN